MPKKQKIEVGPGYRRIGNFEKPKAGDEYSLNNGKSFAIMIGKCNSQSYSYKGYIFRRRLPDPILQVVGRLKDDLNVEDVSFCVDSTDLATAIKWIEDRAK